ncbi:hypothetical protein MNBD_BACTEROID05-728 [hydrothermal vent metagenome]|uniref:Peptidase S1 domain-containing protein n=1 Tax=hydrothermal vent metagenome TaxID=652676 RepID=A0A3B0TFH0_9ZZZZ
MSISENDIVDLLFPYVRSVLGAKNKETPKFVGSGIVLKDHGNLYLVTAGHVMDHFNHEIDRFNKDKFPLFLDGVNGLVAISGEEVSSYTDEPIHRRDDNHDISIVKLSNEIQASLNPTYLINSDKMDLLGEHESQLGYFCVGVPANKGNKSIDKNNSLITPEPYGVRANESETGIYKKLNVNKLTHLALSFNVKKAFSKDNVKRTAPALNGLSGAPIWGFIKKSDTEIQPVIVAILTGYHQKDIKAILGTRIGEVFRDISL